MDWHLLLNAVWPSYKSPSEPYPWDIAYFEHLIAELDALDLPSSDPKVARARELITAFRENNEKLNRSNLLELEQTLLSLQPAGTLLQRAPILRLSYRDVVGERQYSVYKPVDVSSPSLSDDSVKRILLPDLKNLVSGIHWRYILLPFLDEVQTSLARRVLWGILVSTLIWAFVLLAVCQWSSPKPFLAMLATVGYAGVVGGFISALRRVQSVPAGIDSLLTIQALKNAKFYLWLSPLLGAVFAIVLLLIFLGGLVGGTVFPEFSPLKSAPIGPPGKIADWYFWANLYPTGSPDYAKLFLWSFIAGFAERLVPDILDRLIERGQNAVAASSAAGGPPSPPQDGGQETTPKDAAAKDLSAKEAAAKDAAAKDAAAKDAAAKDATAKDAAAKEAAAKDATAKDAAAKEAAAKEAAAKDAAAKDATAKDAAAKDAAAKDAAAKDAAPKDAAPKDAAAKDAAPKEAPEQEVAAKEKAE